MQEYTIQRSTRKCHVVQRPFEPEERYFSAVLQQGGELIRRDYSQDQWHGPPPESIGWWVSRMPAKKTGKMTLAPTSVLLDTLEQLCESPDQRHLAYLLAILLMRRRILTECEDRNDDQSTPLHLVHGNTEREFFVPILVPDSDLAEQLQQKLVELLYCET